MPKPRLSAEQARTRGSDQINAGRFASRQSMPATTGKIGTPPKHLSADVKKVFKEIASAIPEGVAGAADRIAVELASRYLHQFRTEPDMQASKVALLMNLLSRLGLDPQGRTRLQTQDAAPTKQKSDPLALFMSARNDKSTEHVQ